MSSPKSKPVTAAVAVTELKKLKTFPHPVIVNSPETYTLASKRYNDLLTFEKQLKAKKAPILDPLNEAIKEVKKIFKPFEDTIKELTEEYGAAISDYLTKQEEQRLKVIDRVNNDKRLSNPETIQQKLDMAGDRAAGTRQTLELEIVDPGAIPDEFWAINEPLLLARLRSGESIPGARLKARISAVRRS